MKKIIKISLIAFVIIGILFAIIYFANGMGDSVQKPIATTSFEKHVQSRTDSEIKGKDYDEAKKAYSSILQEIATEASIVLGDGTKKLSDEEVLRVKKIAFYEYAPIFADYGTSYFQKSSWDDSMLKELRSEAVSLKSQGIAESGTKVLTTLDKIVTNVNEYYAAWQIAKNASHCSSVSAIATLKNSANKYKHSPLTNNASLSAALNSVEANAKSAVIRNISGYCHSVANRYSNYGSYETWTSAYESACKRIAEYKSSYGYPQELQNARGALDRADDAALNYYSY